MMACIVFSDLTTMCERLHEIGVTPGGCWVWQGPVFDENGVLTGLRDDNLYSPLMGADGRTAMMHNWSEEDMVFLEAQLDDLIVAGKCWIYDSIAEANWVYPGDGGCLERLGGL